MVEDDEKDSDKEEEEEEGDEGVEDDADGNEESDAEDDDEEESSKGGVGDEDDTPYRVVVDEKHDVKVKKEVEEKRGVLCVRHSSVYSLSSFSWRCTHVFCLMNV